MPDNMPLPDTMTQRHVTSEQPRNVLKVLDLSNRHLSDIVFTRVYMNTLPRPVSVMRDEQGFLINTAWLASAAAAELPASLKACLERAAKIGCSYALFDRDGPIDDELPLYEW